MRKLFTTILMMGVALCGWAQLTGSLSSDGKTLTLNYVSDGTELKLGPAEIKNAIGAESEDFFAGVETLVFSGDFANKDLKKMADIVDKCTKDDNTKKVYLDLSGCTKMKSIVEYTGSGDTDWTSNDFEFLPKAEAVTLTVTAEDMIHPVYKVTEPVDVTVDGTEVDYVHHLARTTPKSVWKTWQVLNDLPQDFLAGPVIGQTYSYPNFNSDPNSYIAYDANQEKWVIYAWGNSAYTLTQDEITIYSFEDEYGDTHTQESPYEPIQLTKEGDDFYYVRYGINGTYSNNQPDGFVKVGDQYYCNATITYEYTNEKDERKSQTNTQDLTDNGDGTYSFIYYYYFNKEGKKETKKELAAINGLIDNNDGTYSVNLGTVYTAEYDGETIEFKQHEVTSNGDGTYTASYTPVTFSLTGADFNNKADKLNGIAFPNHANFNYIPADVCSNSAFAGLEDVVFGNYVQWIGENAFANKTNLNDVTFPESLAVIGIDAFYGCSNFYTVNLDLPNLVRVDAAAFNMGSVSDEKNNVREVILPSSTNTTLKFWGNQVFSSSNVTSLDFSKCEGIEHFAYDGYQSFGHDEVHQGETANSVMTFYYHTKLQYISLPPNLLYVGKECFGKCNALETAIFNGRADYNKTACPEVSELNNPLIIDDQAFKDIAALTSVTLSDNITEIRMEAFQATGLTEIHIPASVQVIGVHAFQQSPSLSVVYFDDIAEDCAPCKHAKTVIAGEHRVQAKDPDTGELLFEEDGVTPVYEYTTQQATDPYTGELLYEEDGITPIYEIKRAGDGDGAFFQCPVTDVYVNCPGAYIICENKAFDYTVTFGQTDPDANFGTLHYPAGEEEYYVNLTHYLTNEIANTPGLFQKWLQDHFNWATKPNNNGWHEFINSGPQDITIDEPPYEEEGDFFLRTYSDPTYARIVPTGIKAYIVKNVAKNGDNYELTLQQLRVIPAQTGVILFGQPNANAEGGSTIAMTAVSYAPGEGQPLRRDYWDTLPTELTQQQKQDLGESAEPDAVRMKNYLMPIIPNAQIRNPETDEITETSLLTLRPYEKVGGAVKFRNFVLGHITNTENLSKLDEVAEAISGGENYAAFFRVVSGTKTSGYAFLHLDPTEYSSPSGAECVVIKDDYYTYEYDNQAYIDFGPKTSVEANPNRYWQYAKWEEKTKLWGVRSNFNIPTGKQAVQFLGELEDEVDGIAKFVVPTTENGEYYTLQGVKVTNPTKGVYIHNGQKVIIK